MGGAVYHREIDGLRAVSVLLIILFHLQLPLISGGFIGVDVFFVISGYLITGLLLRELRSGDFSFRRFYLRRIARLLPALLVTIVLSLLAAAVLLSPRALVQSAEEGLAALFSVSNIYFWLEASYWAPKAKNFLLLHTWSLGVEEQFYLLYPVLLVLASRIPSRWALAGLLLLMLVGGAAANHLLLPVDAAAAFYLTPLRFYEFALGGLAALLPLRRPVPAIVSCLGTCVGLALILYSALYFNAFTPFPGINALLPAGGAALVLLAGGSALALPLLANPVMAWLGRLSYSLYLVHWPLIVLYRYYHGPTLATVDRLVLMLLILLLAIALNRFVEQRFRLAAGDQFTRVGVPAARSFRLSAAGVVLASLLALGLIASGGWPGRYPDEMQHMVRQDITSLAREKRLFIEASCRPAGKVFCGRRQAEGNNIMLLADSRGLDIYPALLAAYPGANIYASYALGCAPVFDPNIGRSRHYPDCPRLNRKRLKAALEAPEGEVVFLAMNLNNWRARFALETARKLAASGKRVYVLGESQFLTGKSPREIALDQNRFSQGQDYVERYLVPRPFLVDEKYADKFEAAGATYISSRNFFYQDGYRLFTRDGDELLSYDGLHLSLSGAREFGEFLARRYPLWDGSAKSRDAQRSMFSLMAKNGGEPELTRRSLKAL